MRIISADPSRKRRIRFRPGRDGVIAISFLDSTRAPKDISGIEFDVQFRKRASDIEADFEFTEANGGIVHTSISSIDIIFTKANSAVKAMEYIFTFNRLVLSDGSYKAWLNGPAECRDDIVDNEIDDDTITVNDGGDTIQMTIIDVSTGGGDDHDMGAWDASGNTAPVTGGSGSGGSIARYDQWYLSVGGSDFLGSGLPTSANQILVARVDNPGQTLADWLLL